MGRLVSAAYTIGEYWSYNDFDPRNTYCEGFVRPVIGCGESRRR